MNHNLKQYGFPNGTQTLNPLAKKRKLEVLDCRAFDLKTPNPEPFDLKTPNPEPFDLKTLNPEPFDLKTPNPEPFDLKTPNPDPFDLKTPNPEPFDNKLCHLILPSQIARKQPQRKSNLRRLAEYSKNCLPPPALLMHCHNIATVLPQHCQGDRASVAIFDLSPPI